MVEQKHIGAFFLPGLEPSLAEALEALRRERDYTPAQLVDEIKRQPGNTPDEQARHLLRHLLDETQPGGLAEESTGYTAGPLKKALNAVRKMKKGDSDH